MDLSEQGQRFSFAYVEAVASVAGYSVAEWPTDDDSVDLTLSQRGPGGTVRSPKLDVQVKHKRCDDDGQDPIGYELKLKNYNELRGSGFQAPRIMVVVLVPPDVDAWVCQTQAQLAMRHCGYWVSLRDAPETDNTTSVTVRIPRDRMFTADELQRLMAIAGNGGAP